MIGIWEEFLKIVSQEAGSHVVNTWLNAVSFSHWDSLEKIVYLKAPNNFVQEWIKSNYLPLFQSHLSRLFSVDSVKIVFIDGSYEAQIASESKSSTSTEIDIIPAVANPEFLPAKKMMVSRVQNRNPINKNYHFENFVVGPSNQLAYAAAHAVTEKIGRLYNPLFIYGGSGLGKTHLLHAIGNEIRRNYSNVEILYQTADRFVNEFINAIRFDKVPQFKSRYKDLDVLLIDDVQFISNKEQTQEAFFHIFNMLYDNHKQIVFSSDTDPAGINGLADRLRSRFEWGLVTDIQSPTLETKIAIIKHKASLHDQELSEEVMHYVASRSFSNIRELEGSLIRISAFAALTNQPITVDLVRKVLAKNKETKKTAVDFKSIIKALQRHYHYSLADLRSTGRGKQLSLARQVAMYLMKKLTNKSLQEIGTFLGRKDHTTVLHALQKVELGLKEDKTFYQHVNQLEQEILS